jgi:GNAT superfamily N-acetyltransferase
MTLSPTTRDLRGETPELVLDDDRMLTLVASPPNLLIGRARRFADGNLPEVSPGASVGMAVQAMGPDRRAVGIGGFLMGRPGFADLVVAVAPEWRGVGLGSRLLEVVVEGARERGVRFLKVNGDSDVEGLARRAGLVVARRIANGTARVVAIVPPLVPPTPPNGPDEAA